MAVPWADWDHVLKVDPDKPLPDGVTYADVCEMGTDALEVGGTRGVTQEKMARVIDACSRYDVPLFQEPSSTAAVVHHEGLDGYLIPTVLNTPDSTWIVGVHKEWARIDPDIRWDRTWTEAYIVLNPDSAVAEYTDADCDLRADDVAAYATVAERLLGQAIVYVEYSGTYGDPELVSATSDALVASGDGNGHKAGVLPLRGDPAVVAQQTAETAAHVASRVGAHRQPLRALFGDRVDAARGAGVLMLPVGGHQPFVLHGPKGTVQASGVDLPQPAGGQLGEDGVAVGGAFGEQ
jgi:phosphoglycerol geranylgeranyltransferase